MKQKFKKLFLLMAFVLFSSFFYSGNAKAVQYNQYVNVVSADLFAANPDTIFGCYEAICVLNTIAGFLDSLGWLTFYDNGGGGGWADGQYCINGNPLPIVLADGVDCGSACFVITVDYTNWWNPGSAFGAINNNCASGRYMDIRQYCYCDTDYDAINCAGTLYENNCGAAVCNGTKDCSTSSECTIGQFDAVNCRICENVGGVGIWGNNCENFGSGTPVAEWCSCSDRCDGSVPIGCCGDSFVESGEECDDGNTANGDGCSYNCKEETSTCTPSCEPCDKNCGGGIQKCTTYLCTKYEQECNTQPCVSPFWKEIAP